MAKLQRGKDTMMARITRCDVEIRTSQAGNEYEALVVEFQSRNNNIWENGMPTFPQGDGVYNPTSPGGRFIDGIILSLQAADVQVDPLDFDTEIACGKVFRLEKVPQPNQDPGKPPRTNMVPIELIGEDFPEPDN